MAEAVGINGRVLAVEPLPNIYSQLRNSIYQAERINKEQGKIDTFNFALGENTEGRGIRICA